MIRISDIAPLVIGSLAPLPARVADAAQVPSWFDDVPASGLHIGCDVDAAVRGLGAAEHAQRVLAFLCEPDDGGR